MVQDPIRGTLPADLLAFRGGCDVMVTSRATRGTSSMNLGESTLDSFDEDRPNVGRAFVGFRLAFSLVAGREVAPDNVRSWRSQCPELSMF